MTTVDYTLADRADLRKMELVTQIETALRELRARWGYTPEQIEGVAQCAIERALKDGAWPD